MKNKKQIILDTNKTSDDKIVDNFHALTGLMLSLKSLAMERGKLENKTWNDIKEKYPETEGGSWKFSYDKSKGFYLENTEGEQ